MIGSALKALGVTVLVCAFLGMIVGGGLFLFGANQVADADDRFLFADGRQAEEGQAAAEAGAAVFGLSLIGAGIGLAFLVAGIVIGGQDGRQQQQQQVVIVADGRVSLQQPQK